jgi:uncharacterized membrane protein YfcA
LEPAKLVVFLALGLVAVAFVAYWWNAIRRSKDDTSAAGSAQGVAPTWFETLIAFVTNFFDTFGIGSFATTTSVYKLRGIVADERIPGTLNVGHTPPTIAQAFIFIAVVAVGMPTLLSMIAAAVLGAWLGAPVVARWPRRRIQIGMGVALVVAAALFPYKNLKGDPTGGATTSLEGWRFAAGVIGNFALGVLMTLGIGLYGPCMILVALLGMNPIAAFPIMMGSCAFLMPVGSVRFIEKRSYALRPALGLALGGVPAVLIAVYIVKQLDPFYVRWGVVVVVVYTALAMLRSAMRENRLDASAGMPNSVLPAEKG